tara:strand:- start:19306 stop:19491 length:186 start_codon:yes stop_codon:yes gene_type:complete
MTLEERCSKALILKNRLKFTSKYSIEHLCKSYNISMKQFKKYEKKTMENLVKVMMGTYEVR